MKVKNIMFSGFAAAILMGVGAADAVIANPVTLADQGYVDAKVGQAEAAAKKHFDDKYDSEKTLTTLLADKEDVANKVASVDLEDAEGKLDLAKLSALDSQTDKYPSVSAAKSIAEAVLASVDEVSSQVGTLGTDVAGLKATVGDANSGLVKAVADNTSAIQTLNGDANTEGSVEKSIADALKVDGKDKYELAGAAEAAEAAAKAYADGLAINYETAGAAEAAEAAAKAYADGLATNYETAGAAEAAEAAAKAYTDAEIDKVEVNVTANTTAIEKLNGDGDGSVKKMAADAATAAVNASNHAKQADLEAEVARATAAEEANAGAIDALETGKLDVVESAGTYMVTRDAEGNVSYTKVLVATIDGEGNATVAE